MQTIDTLQPYREEMIALLQANRLPVEDLPENLSGFFGVVEDGKIVGLIGMETYGKHGLLRSMVVDAAYRNRQIADMLVRRLENTALSHGISTMYLLTETAQSYFAKRGYTVTSREDVPEQIKGSSEFSHTCPSSAIVMKKPLEEPH